MDHEREKFEGRLRRQELDAKRTEIEAQGLVISLRDLLDPGEKIHDLPLELINSQASRLVAAIANLREQLNEMAITRKNLGR